MGNPLIVGEFGALRSWGSKVLLQGPAVGVGGVTGQTAVSELQILTVVTTPLHPQRKLALQLVSCRFWLQSPSPEAKLHCSWWATDSNCSHHPLHPPPSEAKLHCSWWAADFWLLSSPTPYNILILMLDYISPHTLILRINKINKLKCQKKTKRCVSTWCYN